MILSNADIKDRLGYSIIIHPFDPRNVNTSSYDVTLGDWYFVERRPPWWRRLIGRPGIYNMWDYDAVRHRWGEPQGAWPARMVMPKLFDRWRWKGIDPEDLVILLPPKRTILAHTIEFIGGREDILTDLHAYERRDPPSTTMMKARSSFGRNGIEVCKCAGYGDVGYINRWTMEITNNLHSTVPLVVGRRIAQIVFMETGKLAEGGDYTATGKYQSTPDFDALRDSWSPWAMLPRLDRDRDIVGREQVRSLIDPETVSRTVGERITDIVERRNRRDTIYRATEKS